MEFFELSELVLTKFALKLPVEDIEIICQTDNLINQKICQNENFWQSRFIQDFGKLRTRDLTESWKLSYLKLSSQELWIWGVVSTHVPGQLGFVTRKEYVEPMKVGSGFTDIAINAQYLFALQFGKLYQKKIYYEYDEDYYEPLEYVDEFPKDTTLIQISSYGDDGYDALALDDRGRVYLKVQWQMIESSKQDQLFTEISYFRKNQIKIQSISCNLDSYLALDNQNIVYVWGWNEEENLGIPNPEEKERIEEPVPLTFFKDRQMKIKQISAGWPNLFLTDQGDVYQMGYVNENLTYWEPTLLLTSTKIKQITRHLYDTYLLDEDENVYINIYSFTPHSTFRKSKSIWQGDQIIIGENLKGQLSETSKHTGLTPTVYIPNFRSLKKAVSYTKFRAALIKPQPGSTEFFLEHPHLLTKKPLESKEIIERIQGKRVIPKPKPQISAQKVSFDQIKRMIDQGMIRSYKILNLPTMKPSPPNVLMMFTDQLGFKFVAEVYYDEQTSMIYPPQ